MFVYYETMNDSNGQFLIAKQCNSISPPHFHSCYEILYLTGGELSATINGVSAQLRKGDLYVAGSCDIHGTFTEKHSECILLIVPLSIMSEYLSATGNRVFKSPFLIASSQSNEILRCLQMLLKEESSDGKLSFRGRGYLYVIFGILMQALGLREVKKERGDPLPQEILLYLQKNITHRLSLNETAKAFGYSSAYFSRFFRRYFGCGFHEYTNILRVHHAAGLLNLRGTILEAALKSGFANQQTFNREFKKVYGKTPSEYKFSSAKENGG